MNLDVLKNVLDEYFSAPFLPDGHVRAKWIDGDDEKERLLQVKIGRRDVWIAENGHVHSSGTSLCE